MKSGCSHTLAATSHSLVCASGLYGGFSRLRSRFALPHLRFGLVSGYIRLRFGLVSGPVVAALAIAMCLCGSAFAGGGAENMLLVVNPSDPSSLQIANAYAALRDIPANNILYITPPSDYHNNGQPISQTEVVNDYLNPIAADISARGLTNQINYIGTIGQPVSYAIAPEPGLVYTNANSMAYALSLLTPLTNGSGLTLQGATSYYSDPYLYMPQSGLYQDPTNIPIGSNTAIQHSQTYSVAFPVANQSITTQYYMAGAIGYTGTNGNTAKQVISSLKASVAADGTTRRAPSTSRTVATTTDRDRAFPSGPIRNRNSPPAGFPGCRKTARRP